jgi:hypothetical protein
MQKNEKRIPLKFGTAVVDQGISTETVNALNQMVESAYKQVSESLRLSPVSARIRYSWIGGSDKNFCATVEEGSQEQIELQAKMDESKRLYGGASTFRKMYVR